MGFFDVLGAIGNGLMKGVERYNERTAHLRCLDPEAQREERERVAQERRGPVRNNISISRFNSKNNFARVELYGVKVTCHFEDLEVLYVTANGGKCESSEQYVRMRLGETREFHLGREPVSGVVVHTNKGVFRF